MAKRTFGVFFMAVVFSGLAFGIAFPATAHAESSIPKPSVPEFTIQIVAYPYDVPTTHSIDPYTGQDITHEGYHVENKSIVVRIKNQPFTPYQIQDSNGNEWTINLHYNIRIRGHFSEDWSELYRPSDGLPRQDYESDYSVFTYVLGEGDAYTYLGTIMMKFPAGGQVDFQVEAMIGYVHREITIPVPGTGWIFTGETSGWSNTQTIIIPTSTPSPPSMPSQTPSPPSPTSTPDQTADPTPEETPQTLQLAAIIGSVIAVAAVGAGFLFYRRKHCREAEQA
jgi:hypothetical protein